MKKAKTVRKAPLYEVSGKAPKADSLGPQAQIVYDALKAHGPITAAVLGTKLSGLKTKQDKTRVAGFYVAQFRADGLARRAKTPKAA